VRQRRQYSAFVRRALPLAKDEALEKLAQALHSKMEHLDPSGDDEWDGLTDRRRDFYRLCVRAIFGEATLVRVALE
jgi:hypothetical protein